MADETVLRRSAARRSRPRSPPGARRRPGSRPPCVTTCPRLAAAQETWFALSGLQGAAARHRVAGRRADPQRGGCRRARRASTPAATPTSSRPRPSACAARRPRSPQQVEQQRAVLEAAVVDQARGRGGRRRGGPPHRRAPASRRRPARGPRPAARPGQRARRRAPRPPTPRSSASPTPARTPSPRAERAQRDFTALETQVAGLDAGEEGLDSEHEDAVGALDEIDEQLARAREEAQQAERDRAGLVARRDALEIGLNRKDGAGALLAATDQVGGLLGSVAALLDVDARLRDRGRRGPRFRRRRRGRHRRRTPPSRRSATSRPTTSVAPGCCWAAHPPPTATGPRCPARRDRTPSTSCARPTTYARRAGAAAAQGRRRRRPRGRPATRRRPARRHRRHPRGRPARCPLRGRWIRRSQPSLIEIQAAVDEADAHARRGDCVARSGSASRSPGSRPRATTPSSASTSRSPSCTSPTPPWPRWPRSSASTARRPAPPRVRPSGSSAPSPPPARPARRTSPGWSSSRPGSPPPRTSPTRSPTPPSANASPRQPGRRGRARWTPVSRCAPPRSGHGRCTVAPTPCCAPRRPSASRAPAPPSAVSG